MEPRPGEIATGCAAFRDRMRVCTLGQTSCTPKCHDARQAIHGRHIHCRPVEHDSELAVRQMSAGMNVRTKSDSQEHRRRPRTTLGGWFSRALSFLTSARTSCASAKPVSRALCLASMRAARALGAQAVVPRRSLRGPAAGHLARRRFRFLRRVRPIWRIAVVSVPWENLAYRGGRQVLSSTSAK